MRGKRICLLALALLLGAAAGCSRKGGGAETMEESVLNERMAGESEVQGVTIRVYHSDDMAEHICVNTALTEEVTPEILLMNLASYGMVPDTVDVQKFTEETAADQGGEIPGHRLILDLSPDFADYLSSMGTSGEFLVMGSLVNTFLDAYDASLIKVTAGGETLETGHQIYDGWLELYDYVQASYSVAEGLLQEGTIIESRYAVERRERTIHERMREYLYALTHHEELETAVLTVGDGVALSVRKPGKASF